MIIFTLASKDSMVKEKVKRKKVERVVVQLPQPNGTCKKGHICTWKMEIPRKKNILYPL